MAIFFESRALLGPAREMFREALQQQPPPQDQLNAQADEKVKALAGRARVDVQPRLGSFVIAAALLAAFAGLAFGAEAKGLTKATEQLWTAFQTILGVIVGFLGGEASGIVSKPPAGD